jgi:hypothetical protein
VAYSPYYELPLCSPYLDIPRNAESLETWTEEKAKQGQSPGGEQERYGRARIDSLYSKIAQLLDSTQELPEKAARPPVSPKQQKKVTAEDRRRNVKDVIEALARCQLWGVTPTEIHERTGIPYPTLCRYLKHPTIKKTWDRYQRESAGKEPANLDAIGDDKPFSFSFPDWD